MALTQVVLVRFQPPKLALVVKRTSRDASNVEVRVRFLARALELTIDDWRLAIADWRFQILCVWFRSHTSLRPCSVSSTSTCWNSCVSGAITTAHELNCVTLRLLWEEVREYWRNRRMRRKESSFTN